MGGSGAVLLGRRELIVGAGLVGAGALVAGCGLLGDDGPERINYGEAPSQFGELYEPDGPSPWPVVVSIHGGSWRAGQELSIMDDACTDLRRRGYAVWNIEYRRVGEIGGAFPGTLDDVGAALDHLAVIGEDHPIALDRTVALGHSAGGTLALWAAARPGLPAEAPGAGPSVRVVAALCLAGVPDLAECARQRLIEDACAQFLGGGPSERPDRYALASPIERLPIGVPQIVVHGLDDRVIPASQAERYAAAAEQAGDGVVLDLIEGADHFSPIEVDDAAWANVVGHLDGLRA